MPLFTVKELLEQDAPPLPNNQYPKGLTWEKLCALEPRLVNLYDRAKRTKDDKRSRAFCANHRWYGCGKGEICRRCHGGLKHELCELVGWGAPFEANPLLRTSRAYDIAYQKIYGVLPPCRNCWCF